MKGKGKNEKLSTPEDLVPKAVVNRDAYLEYVKLKEHPMLGDARIVQTSNANLTLDLGMPIHRLKKFLPDLPEAEQKDILAQHAAVKSLTARLGILKQKSYGLIRGNFIEDNGYLDPRKTELFELFGRFYTTEEVHRVINEQWGLEVSKNTVAAFKTKYLDKITELQEKYKRDYSHVRLGYKRARLDELTYIYQKRKDIYETNPSVENHRLLLQTLEQVRKEVDGDELKVTFEGKLDINATINVHIQNDLLQKISIKDIVIGNLCAKYNVDPKILLHRLHKSFYAKFVGTVKPEDDLLEAEMIYPSQAIYDFDKIVRLNKQLDIEEAQIVEEETKKVEKVKPTGAALKQSLQEKLRQKIEQANKSASNLTKGKDI